MTKSKQTSTACVGNMRLRRFPPPPASATQRRRALAYLADPLSVTEIARLEHVWPSAISQSLAAPGVALAIKRILEDLQARHCPYSEWRVRRLPELLRRYGLTDELTDGLTKGEQNSPNRAR